MGVKNGEKNWVMKFTPKKNGQSPDFGSILRKSHHKTPINAT